VGKFGERVWRDEENHGGRLSECVNAEKGFVERLRRGVEGEEWMRGVEGMEALGGGTETQCGGKEKGWGEIEQDHHYANQLIRML
jgi:hypothetical protein